MSDQSNSLPGLVLVQEPRVILGNPKRLHLGDVYHFPEAVWHGLRRELERLEFGGIPAFARGKRIYTPQGQMVIFDDGQASPAAPITDFPHQAHLAAYRMATDSSYSFNRTYANQYLPEAFYA